MWHLKETGALLIATVVSGWCAAAPGQMCVGDCDGNGSVGVTQLLVVVNVALGNAELAACTAGDANGDGQITVDEILVAVNNALTGCSPLDVSGAWLEDQLHLTSSTCVSQVTQALENGFASTPPCTTRLSVPTVGEVVGVDCNGTSATGQAAPTGTVDFSLPPATATVNGCTVSTESTLSIDLSRSPTTAQYASTLRFAGTCRLPPCQIRAESRWTRQQ